MFKIATTAAFGLVLLSAQPSHAQTCNRSTQPWLDESCKEPERSVARDACRYVTKMRSSNVSRSFSFNEWDGIFHGMAFDLCEQVSRVKCEQSAIALVKSYKTITNSYLKGDGKTLNVKDTMKGLHAENGALLSSIDAYIAKFSLPEEKPLSKSEFASAEKLLYTEAAKIRADAMNLSKSEQNLLERLRLFSFQVADLKTRAIRISSGFSCDFIRPEIKDYNQDVQDLSRLLGQVRSEIYESRRSRDVLLALAYEKLRVVYFHSFTKGKMDELDKIKSELESTLAVGRLVSELSEWWDTINASGLAGNIHTRYFAYSEPLRILRISRQTAEGYKVQLDRLANFSPSAAKEGLALVSEMQKRIDTDINFIEENGWQGFLSIQLASTDARLSLLPQNKSCQEIGAKFKDLGASVRSLEDFDRLTALYISTTEVCVE